MGNGECGIVARMKRLLALVVVAGGVACNDVKSPHPSAEIVFDSVAPSVVAVVNDDTKDCEEEIKRSSG